MQTIYKYKVEATDHPNVILPAHAEILSARAIGDDIYIWARVDPEQLGIARQLAIYGTGHPVQLSASQLRFIDTVLMYDGRLVFHVFEVTGF